MRMYVATIPAKALDLKPREAYYARQRKMFVALVLMVSIVPLFVISWTSSHFYRQSWQRQTSLALASLAASRKEVINLFLASQEHLLASLVELYALADLANPQELERVFRSISRSGVIVDLGIIDRSGRHLAYAGPFGQQLLDKNYSESKWFKEVIANGRYVSDVFTGFRGVPHFVVAVTAADASWILRATINSELFNALLDSTAVGPGGDAFIINSRGELQTPSRHGASTLSAAEFAAIRSESDNLVFAYQDFLYSSSGVKNGDWLLVLKTDIHTSLAEFYRARNRDWLIISGAALSIFAVAALLVRSMVGQIEKADSQRLTLNNRMRQVEKMALIGRLAAGVAHEINNPLQIIGDQAGWIEELLEDSDADQQTENFAEQRKAAAKIREQVKRASTITHRLLGFSRRESGKTVIDLNQLLEESLAFLENEAKKRRIIVRKNLLADIGPVLTDPSLLQQVFFNILNNGIDAIGEDGAITVTTARSADKLTVECADTGPGLAPAILAQIFDPFFTTKAKGQGTGLGLSISYDIMQRLGGDIQARNGTTRGCVFTVILPATIMATAAKAEAKQKTSTTQRG